MDVSGVIYTDSNMTKAAELCQKSMMKNGVSRVYTFGDDYIPVHGKFKFLNKEIFDNPKGGGGCWLWKSYVIYETMRACKDDQYCVYSDAGIEWIGNVNEIISRMDQDIFFFTNGYPHVQWCKADVIDAMLPPHKFNASEQATFSNLNQVQATVIVFRVNDNTRKFVKEWLLWCQMPGFIDDSESKLPNHPSFKEHRHDQSILTCLQIKYGYKLHFWPTQYSEHIRHTALPGDDYPLLFNHHRKRNHEW